MPQANATPTKARSRAAGRCLGLEGEVGRVGGARRVRVDAKPTSDEALAILAFALQANGVQRADAVDAGSLDTIVLHP